MLAHVFLLTAGCEMMLAFVHVLQPIDPCTGTRGTTICGLNASRSKHHRNTRQIIGLRPTNQHVDLALIAATCITFPTAAATIPFVPFTQTNGLPPHLDVHTHYLPQAAVTNPHGSLPPPHPTPHKLFCRDFTRTECECQHCRYHNACSRCSDTSHGERECGCVPIAPPRY